MVVMQRRLEDRGVPDVLLLAVREVLDLDGENAFFGVLSADQSAEHGVGVEAGQTTPHEARAIVDQPRPRAVADHGKLEIRSRPHLSCSFDPKANPAPLRRVILAQCRAQR